MSLNLGIETLATQTTPMSVEDCCEMFEEFAALDQAVAQAEVSEAKIQMAVALLESASQLPEDQKKVVYDFLGQDPVMAKAIAASEEGQKLQDYFRWGLPGMLIGLYLGSFGRIRKCLANPQLAPNKKSQYLLPEKYVESALNGCDKFIAALKSGKAEQLAKAVQDCGGTVDSLTDTDWVAVLGSFVGGMVGSLIPFGAIVGNIVGKNVSEKVRTSAQDHGYTQENFKKHCAHVLKLIDEVTAIKQLGGDVAAAGPFAKKCLKWVAQGVSTIGRGFCAICM